VNEEAAEIQATHQWGRDWAMACQRLDDLRERVEMTGRRKDDFLASMSHELRTPLNSIVGFATLLDQRRGGELTPKQASFISNILTASRHLLTLINELLDIAKVDAGRLELNPELLPAQDCASEVLTVLTPQAASKGIRIETHGSAINIYADRLRLKQILYNLLSNAIKFSPTNGLVTMEFATVEVNGTQQSASVTVSDNGPGIPDNEQPAVFERFQSRATGTKQEEGTGLGLAITKRLVEAHGGTISVDSSPRKGARFQVTFPYPSDHSLRDGIAASSDAITVIEGEPGTGLLIRSILEPHYGVKVYSSWAEACRTLAKDRPRLVFVDGEIADASSEEVLRQIRQNSTLPAKTDVAVLIRDAAREGFDPAAGFDYVIRKPLGDGRHIRECVEQSLVRLQRVAE
jgi:nitrogen-specific signal transduction histidine kinase/CheY-like chemotaxis protein